MTMTRKDFDALAAIIRDTVANIGDHESITPTTMAYLIAEKIGLYAYANNPRFNMSKWRETIGYSKGA